MLTLVVRAGNDPATLAETLAPFVDGVVKGLIGRLYVVATGGAEASSGLVSLVEDAGADLIISRDWRTGLAEAAKRAGAAGLCIVEAGVVPGEGFFAALDRLMRMTPAGQNALAATRPRSLRGRVMSALLGRVSSDQILVISAVEAQKGAWNRSFGRRLTVLDSTSRRIAGI